MSDANLLVFLRRIYDGQNSEPAGHSGVGTSKLYRCPSQQSAGVAGREDTGWDEHTEFCLFWCGVCRGALPLCSDRARPADRFWPF